jgi:hypothetical protein
MVGEAGRVTTVVQQEGDQVLIRVPMVGFPQGFTLRPGDKVALVNEENGPEVRPLLRVVTLEAAPQESAAEVTATGGQRYAVPAAAVRTQGGSHRHVLMVVDNDAGAPPQAMSVRTQ